MSGLYCFDTSAFLQAWRRSYRPAVFVTLWQRLDDMINSGKIIASHEVLGELAKKDDEVYKWVKQRSIMFVPIDEPVQLEVRNILRAHPRLIDTRNGRSGADPFVIGLAKLKDACVVTDEFPSNNPDKPKIPDVCGALKVPCCRLQDVFEREGLTF